MRNFIRKMEDKAIKNERLSYEEGCRLIQAEGPDIIDLISSANRVRQHFCGDQVNLCSISNAKSGNCSENCSFCSQSAYHGTAIDTYPLTSSEKLVSEAKAAAGHNAEAFGVVVAWWGLREGPDLDAILERIRALSAAGHTRTDASLGSQR